MRSIRPITATLGAVTLSLTACLPYSMGSTAQTVPAGEHRTTSTLWFMPNGLGLRDDSLTKPHTLRGADAETRWGIDDESDFGIRVPTASGIVLSYKKRAYGFPHPDSAALAWQLGGGLVNGGDHAYGEFTLLASGARHGGVVAYGGARVMQVWPISEGAVNDQPSIGGFLGARISIGKEGEILPELAVYHDPSALHIRRSDVIFVPSISFRGITLPRAPMPFGRF